MKIIKPFMIIALMGFSFLLHAQRSWPAEFIIAPEKSNFTKTSTYHEVMQFIHSIKNHVRYAHVMSMGKSPEGKDIPVVVLADPKITSPQEAKESQKPVIYIQGNIHAGEV